jgi:hypothetical protein
LVFLKAEYAGSSLTFGCSNKATVVHEHVHVLVDVIVFLLTTHSSMKVNENR